MQIHKPTGKQRRSIAEAEARLNIWHGSVRSGKTVASVIRWLDFVARGPEGNLLMVGKTERTLKRNVLDLIAEIVGEDSFRLVQGSGECHIFGRRIYLAGANDERSETKIRGLTLAGAYGDELSTWPESFFNMLLSRLSVEGARLFGSTNPDNPFHWLKENYLDREGELDLRAFHFGIDDNPALSPDFVQALKAEYSGVWHQRFIEGQWVLAEGLVYSMFDRQAHVVKELPKMRETWIGVDYGTSNPTAFLLVGLGVDGRLYVMDEYYHAGTDMSGSKTDSEYSRDMETWLGEHLPRWIFVDPSAKSFRTQLYRDRKRCPVFGNVAKADNEVLDGIRKVSSLLGVRRLLVHERCVNTIKEFGLYSWDARAQEKGQDKPLPGSDHAMDALRYVVGTLGPVYDRVMKKGAA